MWAVAVHDDLTVWAADSKGNTHVIDARMGLVMKRFRSPHAPRHAHLTASPPQHPRLRGLSDLLTSDEGVQVAPRRRRAGACDGWARRLLLCRC